MNIMNYSNIKKLTPEKMLQLGKDLFDAKDYGAALYYLSFAEKAGEAILELAETGKVCAVSKERATNFFAKAALYKEHSSRSYAEFQESARKSSGLQSECPYQDSYQDTAGTKLPDSIDGFLGDFSKRFSKSRPSDTASFESTYTYLVNMYGIKYKLGSLEITISSNIE